MPSMIAFTITKCIPVASLLLNYFLLKGDLTLRSIDCCCESWHISIIWNVCFHGTEQNFRSRSKFHPLHIRIFRTYRSWKIFL